MAFSVSHRDPGSRARTGSLALNHGTVATPCFMPVGTNATVKAIKNSDLEAIGVNLILGNTYHLYLRPGRDVIRHAGGLHSFMGWRHNILTDSGGYQVFSLSSFRKVEDEGVFFKSHLDGSSHRLTPEDVLDMQLVLGSDVIMPLDECTPPGIDRDHAVNALQRTTAWLERTNKEWKSHTAAMTGQLFGIMQGNFYKDLRERSASEIAALDLPGYAIGGLSVGEEFPVFSDLLHHSASFLPDYKPKYLMGIGTPKYILEAVEAGIDLFDCVFPTRTARNAQVFSSEGPLSLRNEKYKNDFRPIDEACECETCRNHSRAYLRHLFKAKEIQAAVLATCHNLTWLHRFVESIRNAISRDDFPRFKTESLERLGETAETLLPGDP
jgi:queuine tRNA-ribosyltransferase